MTKHVAINAILAIGVTFVILTGGIDLSVGSIAGLAEHDRRRSAVQGPRTARRRRPLLLGRRGHPHRDPGRLRWSARSTACSSPGSRCAPFIATLGMLYVARGVAQLRSNGSTFPNLAGTPRRAATRASTSSAWTAARHPGRCLDHGRRRGRRRSWSPPGPRSAGASTRSAATSAPPCSPASASTRVKIAVYVISGACAALAGLLLTSELGAAYPDTATTYELNAIAAAVLGGTALSGGRGTIIGTVMGAFVIGFLSDGLVLVGVSTFWQSVVKGAVIIFAVITEQAQQRLQSRLASRTS